jgi:hypothetical protein
MPNNLLYIEQTGLTVNSISTRGRVSQTFLLRLCHQKEQTSHSIYRHQDEASLPLPPQTKTSSPKI